MVAGIDPGGEAVAVIGDQFYVGIREQDDLLISINLIWPNCLPTY